jgi:thioredoxin-like negative regulator of GroEL
MQDWTPETLQEHIEAGKGVFLKLWKKGCGACKLSTPSIERLEAANEHGLVFAQICTDDHPEMLEIADTEVLPTFFVFRDKSIAGTHIGFKGLERLKAFVDEAVKKS